MPRVEITHPILDYPDGSTVPATSDQKVHAADIRILVANDVDHEGRIVTHDGLITGQGVTLTTHQTELDSHEAELNALPADPTAAIAARLNTTTALVDFAKNPDKMSQGTITYDTSGAPIGHAVLWPDGATGVYAGVSAAAPSGAGAVDSWTVTHVSNGVTTTYVQPAVTRDATSGLVTVRPPIVLTAGAPVPPTGGGGATGGTGTVLPFIGDPATHTVPVPTDAFGSLALPYGAVAQNTFWTFPGVSTAPLHPNSAAIITELVADVNGQYGPNAAMNLHQFNTAICLAPSGTQYVKMGFFDAQAKGSCPASFAAVLASVPVPVGVRASTGSDGEVSIIDCTNGDLFDLWQFAYYPVDTMVTLPKSTRQVLRPAGYSACWGGKTNIFTTPGWFLNGMGASSTGDLIASGVIGIREAQIALANGTGLGHAINMATPTVAPASAYQWPGQRGDGGSGSTSLIAEGQWFRLDPTFDVAGSNMNPFGKMVAWTAQSHGIVNTDQAGAVALIGESRNAITAAGMPDPWNAMITFNGVVTQDYNLLTNFPWNRMQALTPNWGATGNAINTYRASGLPILENGQPFITATDATSATTLTTLLNYDATPTIQYHGDPADGHRILDANGVLVATGTYVATANRAIQIMNAA